MFSRIYISAGGSSDDAASRAMALLIPEAIPGWYGHRLWARLIPTDMYFNFLTFQYNMARFDLVTEFEKIYPLTKLSEEELIQPTISYNLNEDRNQVPNDDYIKRINLTDDEFIKKYNATPIEDIIKRIGYNLSHK